MHAGVETRCAFSPCCVRCARSICSVWDVAGGGVSCVCFGRWAFSCSVWLAHLRCITLAFPTAAVQCMPEPAGTQLLCSMLA